MTEAILKRKLVKALHTAMPEIITFRHEDKTLKAIPDLSATTRGRTWWVEVKFSKKGRKRSKLSATQAAVGQRLTLETEARAIVVDFFENKHGKQTEVRDFAGTIYRQMPGHDVGFVADVLAGNWNTGML